MTNRKSGKGDSTIRIAIIEDNPYVREAWCTTFALTPDFVVVGAYRNCETAFTAPEFADADIVLMDIGLPGMSGTEGVAYIAEHHPEMNVIMCTVHEESEKIFDALCAGAVGYLLKEIEPDELVRAIRSAADGGSPMTPRIARKVIAHFQRPPRRSADVELTEREHETLELLAQGKSYAAIAEQLYISVDGVGGRIRKIYEKLQAHTRGEAVAKGLAKRLINPPRA
jgi:DNA-binding NarL/FixJ family response regulator